MSGRHAHRLLSPALAALALAAGIASGAETPSRLADCDAAVQRAPADYASYDCYRTLAREQRGWEGAIDRLEDRLAQDPHNTLARVVLARIESDRGGRRAEGFFRTAAEEFAAAAMPVGEVFARLDLALLLRRQGRLDEAAAEVERARSSATAARVPLLLTNVRAEEAWIAEARADYVRAYELFRQAEQELFPTGPWTMQDSVLSGLGATLFHMGRHAESLGYYRRLADAHRAHGNLYEEASDLRSLAILTSHLVREGSASEDEERRLVDEALEAAVRTGNRRAEAGVRQMIADDESLDLATRIRETEQALALAEESGDETAALYSLRQLANLTAVRDPDHPQRAYDLADEAVRRGRATGGPATLARGLIRRAQVRWILGPRERALDEAFEALDAIERIRDLQSDDLVRARLVSEWSFYYYLLSGAVLDEAGDDPRPEDLELAFSILERLRGRVLLDALDAAGATSALGGAGPLHEQRATILHEIADGRQRLLDARLAPAERREGLDRLERLEAQEARLRDSILRADPTFAALRRPALPTLDDLREALRRDEAVLAFQIANRVPWRARGTTIGGSFVFVITRDAVHAHGLPEERELSRRISLYLGLVDRRDGSHVEGSAALHRDLLAAALGDLPPEVSHLVIVPDKALFRLPFDTLQPAAGEEPLAARYRTSIAPSAALWLRWRRAGDPAAPAPEAALVLADPQATAAVSDSAGRDTEPAPAHRARLGPLPYTRREARAIERALGGNSRVVLGADASESFLASADLRGFGVLHFAAHAVIDDREPDRSALRLAAGSADRDGLLHIREIVGLDLRGSVVVLSACRSSAGPLLDGEGAMSLARGFFQAGARAVVGNLWPLRDDEAASFVSTFYRHLARGVSVADALAQARRDALHEGTPAAAWAGWVVMGDGSAAPVARAEMRDSLATPLLAALALLLAVVVIVARVRRRPA